MKTFDKYDLEEKKQLMFIVGIGILLIVGAFICLLMQTTATKKILLENNQRIASSLLQSGVNSTVIAKAFQKEEITVDGINLLSEMGITLTTNFWLWNLVSRAARNFGFIEIPMFFFISIILFIGTMRFIKRRDEIYENALKIVNCFSEGDFETHLSRNEAGIFYHLLGAVDQLAMTLKTKNERERNAKEFLKTTLSDISHQLKTPLAALNMYNEIILGEPENRDVVVEFSQKSQESLARMERLILTILKIMRMDADSISFKKEDCDVRQLVMESIEDLKERAKRETKQIILDGTEEVVFCDKSWTKEAIANLIKNALDYTKENGQIRISWKKSPALLRLQVSDDGCGISSEDIHHIFKRFYRSKQSRDTQGVGLGLPLAKAIIEGQGGIVSVQSEPGQGTTFTLSFMREN